MYIYKCKNCGKEITYDVRDGMFGHRGTLKYYCTDEKIGGKRAEPECNKLGQKIVVADIPPKYVNYPPKSYEQRVHEMWYQQLPDGGTFDIITDQFSCSMGRDAYVDYNIKLVHEAAKYINKEPEQMFNEIWCKNNQDDTTQ